MKSPAEMAPLADATHRQALELLEAKVAEILPGSSQRVTLSRYDAICVRDALRTLSGSYAAGWAAAVERAAGLSDRAAEKTEQSESPLSATFSEFYRSNATTIRSLALSPQADEADGWRTMESAPKDGTVIDVWRQYYIKGKSVRGSRLTNISWARDRWVDEDEDGIEWGPDQYEQECRATHWRPLPAQPSKR